MSSITKDKEAVLVFREKDIATIEKLHDMLLDHGHKVGEETLKESRNLTGRMYESLKWGSNNE